MHDIRFIRDDADAFDAGMKRRGLDPQAAAILALDQERRALQTDLQDAQKRRNDASKLIGKAKGQGDEAEAQRLMDEVGALKAKIQSAEERERALAEELDGLLAGLPNVPSDDVPDGDVRLDSPVPSTRESGMLPAAYDPGRPKGRA